MVALASKSVKTARRSASPRYRQSGVVQEQPRPLPPPQPFRFTVKDYYLLGEIGILKENDRVELIQGEIIMMPPIDITHAQSTNRSTKALIRLLGGDYDVRNQTPVRLGPDSEPIPDFSVAKLKDYKAHPTAADVLLVLENSNTSLREDLGRKKLMYAAAGIPEYWVVDLNARVLHVFARPKGGDYMDHRIHEEKETVQSITLKPLKLKVAELLP